MNGVCNGAGWRTIKTEEDFEFLKTVKNEPKGNKHIPLQHHEAISIFNDRIAHANVKVKENVALLSPNQQKMIYMTKVGDQELPDLDFFLGFLSFNDKTRSVSVLSGTSVFVCSNLTFRADCEMKKQKHIAGVEDGTVSIFDAGIEDFWKYRENRLSEISRMKEVEVSRDMQGQILLDMLHSPILGRDPAMVASFNAQFEKPVHDEFIDRSLWHYQNAATEELKKVSYYNRLKTDKEVDRILLSYCK